MKTLAKIPLRYVHVKYMPADEDMEERTVYVSLEFSLAIHMCLCGCRTKSVMPFNKPGEWQFMEENNTISFVPSVLNNLCPNNYDYIITNSVANVV